MSPVATPMVAGLGTTELLIILGVLILLFGARKLPELARGSGRALRIFKAETKGLMDDDEDDSKKTPEQKQIEAQQHPATPQPDAGPETRPTEARPTDADR
ncbi:MAG TPA: Sec-independent protein translocase subunit TatA [Nocardioidaceae bacterium]|nr:Sec-independent protein translocase subunit TatA [Nocardioidaceae bacterium]